MSICVRGGIFKLKTLHLHILCICMIHVSEGEPVMAHVWRLRTTGGGLVSFHHLHFLRLNMGRQAWW